MMLLREETNKQDGMEGIESQIFFCDNTVYIQDPLGLNIVYYSLELPARYW